MEKYETWGFRSRGQEEPTEKVSWFMLVRMPTFDSICLLGLELEEQGKKLQVLLLSTKSSPPQPLLHVQQLLATSQGCQESLRGVFMQVCISIPTTTLIPLKLRIFLTLTFLPCFPIPIQTRKRSKFVLNHMGQVQESNSNSNFLFNALNTPFLFR